jgi:hypothetical protein
MIKFFEDISRQRREISSKILSRWLTFNPKKSIIHPETLLGGSDEYDGNLHQPE